MTIKEKFDDYLNKVTEDTDEILESERTFLWNTFMAAVVLTHHRICIQHRTLETEIEINNYLKQLEDENKSST